MKKILDVSQEEYFALNPLSQSAMKDFRNKGPWSYYHQYVDKVVEPPKPSDSMRLGTALHAVICPDVEIEEVIAVMPEYVDFGGAQPEKINKRLKLHRAWIEDWTELNKDKIVLSPDEMVKVIGMRNSVIRNPAIKPWLNRLTSERSEVVATNEINGWECKGMCDADFSDEGVIIDFKTTRQHLGVEFAKDAIWKYGYQYQAAHYCDVFEAERFLIVAIRNFAPFESMVFEIPSEFIGQARLINHQTIDRIKWCHHANEWHSDGWGEIINIEDVLNNDNK